MKVSEYIALLQKQDQDAEVVEIAQVRGRDYYYQIAQRPRALGGPIRMLDDMDNEITPPAKCVFVGGISP